MEGGKHKEKTRCTKVQLPQLCSCTGGFLLVLTPGPGTPQEIWGGFYWFRENSWVQIWNPAPASPELKAK